MWIGFLTVAFTMLPSPKFHCQIVGPFVVVSVKVTVNGAVPNVGVPVNDAVGGVIAAADTTI